MNDNDSIIKTKNKNFKENSIIIKFLKIYKFIVHLQKERNGLFVN